MNYQKHYNILINRAKNRLLEGYVEKHHIIPRCMNGSNDIENIVSLTPEEHYVAHQLLVKIYPNEPKLIYAAKMMTVKSPDHKRRNNKLYGWLRKHVSKQLSGTPKSEEQKRKQSEKMKGKIPWNKGIPCTEEWKQNISDSKKGKNNGEKHPNYGKTTPEEVKRKISNSLIGKHDTEEHKRKISERMKGKKRGLYRKKLNIT